MEMLAKTYVLHWIRPEPLSASKQVACGIKTNNYKYINFSWTRENKWNTDDLSDSDSHDKDNDDGKDSEESGDSRESEDSGDSDDNDDNE